MINKIDLRKAISSIAISNAKRNTIYKAFSDLDSITKEEFDSVKSDISKVVESMLTKDAVGKANGVASLDSDGNVPIEQLGNIDTTLFLIVRELPTTDIKTNKIYLVPNQDGQGNNVYIEYLYVEGVWEKVGEFKPEVDLSHIEQKLDTKADKTDVNSHLDDLRNYCFKLCSDGRISTPFYDNIMSFDRKIQQLNNNEEYTYADINEALNIDGQQFIYDKTFNKFIKIIKIDEVVIDTSGDFFRTAEPLDLTHTFYLDNEKTGIVENLSQLAIEESNIFVNLPYLDTNDTLDDDTAPQYIYDVTDNKWIEVIETYYSSDYYVFNTEEPLDLTHELYYSTANVLMNWTVVGKYSVALGFNSSANSIESVALGTMSNAGGDCAIALGTTSNAGGDYAIALGKNVSNTKSIFGVGFNGVNGIDMDRDNYGLYLRGFGGYDGTNLVVKNGGTETLNPNIKSVQDIINEKADASAIPTKVSQLINDSNFATPDDNVTFAGLIVNNNAKIKYIQKTGGAEGTYLIAETPDDRVANKVFAADGSLFDVGKLVSLPFITGKLSNITAATTTEDMITKFNDLLADLKAKGYMEADTPQ